MNYIDIFAGCGGLSLGLYQAGLEGIFAIEKNKDAFSTLKYNLIDNKKHFRWPNWLEIDNLDICDVIKNHSDELLSLRNTVSLVVGGPPCQGFSMAGKRNSEDTRNKLFKQYLKFIRLVQPDTIIFENVHGFTVGFNDKNGKKAKSHSQIITDALKRDKYKVSSKLINMSEFGVPQNRKRFILVASKVFDPNEFFVKLYENRETFFALKGIEMFTNVENAISDLLRNNNQSVECIDSKGFLSSLYGEISSNYQLLMRQNCNKTIPDSHRFAKHRPATIELFENLMNDTDVTKRYTPKTFEGLRKRGVTVLKSDGMWPTVTSIPDDFIHYCEPRIPTVRELARIQSFPDWYEFKGPYTTGGERRKFDVPRYTQVANAVPPLFAEQLGLTLLEMIN